MGPCSDSEFYEEGGLVSDVEAFSEYLHAHVHKSLREWCPWRAVLPSIFDTKLDCRN